jgi:PAS domain S-box-containing protein
MKTEDSSLIDSVIGTSERDDYDTTREISKVTPGSGASMQQLARLSETLLAMAAGDFSVRVDRTFTRDPFDVLAYLVNNTADELEGLISRVERQNDQLESILDSMADGILLLDADGLVRRTNHSMLRMLGLADESALFNLPLNALVTDRSLGDVTDFSSRDRSGPSRAELEFDTANGIEVFPAVSNAIRSGSEITGFVVVVQDDRQLREARARNQLSDRMTAMGAMAAGVAHEINNPLAYVAANIDYVMSLFESGADAPADAAEALADALDGVRRVREIVADLNSFSRADDESKSIVNLLHVVKSAVKMLSSDLRHRVTLDMRLPDDLPLVEANEARLVQVFVNILLNAMQALEAFPKEERRIELFVEQTPSEVAVMIRDNGPGIAESDLPRIFDAFFTTKPVGKGTGLGLAISHQTIENLGGRIDVDSQVGEGTTFRVVIPARGASARRAEPSGLRSLSEASERIVSSSILIIDDELALARALERILSGTHDVTIVTDPAEAAELLVEADFGAVLCDVMMPRVSGIDLYRQTQNARPEMAERFIFMTGGAFTPAAQAFLEEVDVPCLRKPFDVSELSEHLDRLIDDE